ncbi:hypothetical protein Q5H93_21295 [Hymenobacter sp. ASUV-10]|uniref:Uncharacterized protein n=1 Tax=Hymenobacter aranciens TaxID=3063996 RepID=A0ABT9BGB2_9BACT|nr:hypothetical protein [Hymenobacter sp. ASUV-10]MDO7877294.1 hypothetical protein [Hymenobacter sp. ASUV-10]
MENNRMNSLVLRDKATVEGLADDKPHYEPLEEDIAPLRDEHAANTLLIAPLAETLLETATDDATEQKTSSKKQLKNLGERLAGAMQGYAASKANTDTDLPGKVNINRTDLNEADDASFATILRNLLKVAEPFATQVAKREFSAEDRTEMEKLLDRFEKKQVKQQVNRTAGSTDLKKLEALLRRNASLIKEIRKQLKAYKNSKTKHAVWERFVSYTKIINRPGGGGSKPQP